VAPDPRSIGWKRGAASGGSPRAVRTLRNGLANP